MGYRPDDDNYIGGKVNSLEVRSTNCLRQQHQDALFLHNSKTSQFGNECKASPEQVDKAVVVFAKVTTVHRGNNIRISMISFARNWCSNAGTGGWAIKEPALKFPTENHSPRPFVTAKIVDRVEDAESPHTSGHSWYREPESIRACNHQENDSHRQRPHKMVSSGELGTNTITFTSKDIISWASGWWEGAAGHHRNDYSFLWHIPVPCWLSGLSCSSSFWHDVLQRRFHNPSFQQWKRAFQ